MSTTTKGTALITGASAGIGAIYDIGKRRYKQIDNSGVLHVD